MPQLELSQVTVYPVKSIAGISLSSVWVEKQGLTFDRRFMLAFYDGGMVTARRFPQMVTIRSALLVDGLRFSYPNRSDLVIHYRDFDLMNVETTVWNDSFVAYSTTKQACEWFSSIIGEPVQLLFSGEQSNRVREKVGHNVSFADGYPLLLIGEASLEELNARSSEHHDMAQFRPNLVVRGANAFAEDRWKRIKIGDVEFLVSKPCERCVLTTVDVETGAFRSSQEPLKTLATFRANANGGIFFGQNLVALNEGFIHQHDRVEVLEYQEAEKYQDIRLDIDLRCESKTVVARDFVAIDFSLPPQQTFDFIPGQYISIELPIDGESISRCYSIVSAASDSGTITIAVKRVAGGKASNWLIDTLLVGDSITGFPAQGEFVLADSSAPILLLSAGSGITPLLSMLRFLRSSRSQHPVVFYHQCRCEDDIPYRAELEALQQEHANVTVYISLTQPPNGWAGLCGRLSRDHIEHIPQVASHQVYVCGPEGFMNQAQALLKQQGLPDAAYHQENFTIAVPVEQEHYPLNLAFNGTTIIGNNQFTLLEQAERNGIAIANSCRAGLCGACRVKVSKGDIEQAHAPALAHIDTNDGMVLACCCIPLTDVEVEY
jgi:uncharacterized protein YcbX/ferredoxin-NADP reductase